MTTNSCQLIGDGIKEMELSNRHGGDDVEQQRQSRAKMRRIQHLHFLMSTDQKCWPVSNLNTNCKIINIY